MALLVSRGPGAFVVFTFVLRGAGSGQVAQRGFAASFQQSAFSDQLPICDKFAGWAPWMSFSEPEVPAVQRLIADRKPENLRAPRRFSGFVAQTFLSVLPSTA
jgi:hypothetical protein